MDLIPGWSWYSLYHFDGLLSSLFEFWSYLSHVKACHTCYSVLLYHDQCRCFVYVNYLDFSIFHRLWWVPPHIPINKPSFNWESANLHDSLKLFKEQCNYLLVSGPFKSTSDTDKVSTFLTWLGPKSYGILNHLVFPEGKSKTVYQDVIDQLGVIDGLVLKCDRIIIWVSLRQDTLDKLYQSHLGIRKSLL